VVTVRQDPAQEQEWLQENNLIYGALIAVGVVMVQPFLTAASLGLSARVCVVAFSVAIPLLAALVVVNRREVFRHRAARSPLVTIAKAIAQNSAFVGVVAGVGILVSGLAGVAVHTTGYMRLERNPPPPLQEAEEPGDTE
jgi:ABC-type uncharacterized transport system permease subunit